jgi:hypothetical protein
MAANFLRFPNGGGCRPWVIATVTIEDGGVAANNAEGQPIGWVPVTNLKGQEAVAEKLMACLDAGKRFEQPDWEALVNTN